MKKGIIVLLSVLMIFSCFGCGSSSNNSQYEESLRKAQKIEIIDANSEKIISSISTQQDITKLIDEMKVGEWKVERKLSEDLTKKYIYRYYASPTVTFEDGEKKQGELEHILDLITYENEPYITIKVGGIELSFDVGGEVSDILNKK